MASRVSTCTLVLPCHSNDSRQGGQTLLETSRARASFLIRHSQAKCSRCASESATEQRGFVVSLLYLGQNQRAGWMPPACSVSLPSLSQCSRLTVQCLQKQEGAWSSLGSTRGQDKFQSASLEREPCPLELGCTTKLWLSLGLNSVSVQQTNQHSLQHSPRQTRE